MTKPQRATPHARRQFQSTPSVWRETCNLCRNAGCSMISIHSLRVEGDKQRCLKLQRPFSISIHSLRVEGDLLSQGCRGLARNFNPLPPCGGRPQIRLHRSSQNHFNPLPPCGGRRQCQLSVRPHPHFNPLPPCGGRHQHYLRPARGTRFQSTPSVWRETAICKLV